MSSKQREALNQLLGLIDNGILVFNKSLEPSEISQAQYHIDKAGEAYEEPLKNCEVGTVDEQYARWNKHCQSMGERCSECSLGKNYFDLTAVCYAKWSQMPYEEVKGWGRRRD